jgi:hypothetical protein
VKQRWKISLKNSEGDYVGALYLYADSVAESVEGYLVVDGRSMYFEDTFIDYIEEA